jgi:methylated-DNA-[protein]-cysteine S-methyltransferase
MKHISYLQFSSGSSDFFIAQSGGKIIKISFGNEKDPDFFQWIEGHIPGGFKMEKSDGNDKILNEARKQILEYLEGSRRKFDLPLELTGTDFQKSVWNQLAGIPWGETKTYGQVARAAGKPKASRAVGGACNKNPLPLVIPCHRVVGSDGSLVGFGGGLDLKERLLEIESKNS